MQNLLFHLYFLPLSIFVSNKASSQSFPDHKIFFPISLSLTMVYQPEFSVVNRYFKQKEI